MDALSVAATVVGLISFCVDVGSYLADVKNAPKNAERLHAQVLSLRQVLGNLDAFLQGENAKCKTFAKTCALVQSTEACKYHLVRLSEKLRRVNKTILHRVTFPLDEKDINQSIEILRGCAQTFQFSLTVDGWYALSLCEVYSWN